MAEGVLFDLAGKVLEVAGSFALQEIKLASGVKAELEQSKEQQFPQSKAVLLDAEKKASHSVCGSKIGSKGSKMSSMMQMTCWMISPLKLCSLTKQKHEESLEMLQIQLREKLNGKKYLLVLDDVWNEDKEKWLLLRNLLMVGATGSRIIMTTRSMRVVRITEATSWHALEGLPQEKAWSLFVKMAFEQGQLPENQAFISLGKEIVEKCGGVPLAIRTIGGLLHSKDSENEWQSFKDYELSKITQEEENCFQKIHEIDVKTLICLWAAQEGFNAARSSCGWCKTKKATSSGGLSELKELSNLGGILFIQKLGHGKDDMVECKATNMKEKQHLQHLALAWDYDSGMKKRNVMMKSHWKGSSHIQILKLWSCGTIWYLPPLNKLPFLKSLTMWHMEALEYISEEEDSGWWRKDYDNEPDHLLLPSFPCLSQLEIGNCPKLTSMPPFPYIKESLKLSFTSSKVLQQTMKMGTRQRASTATTSTSSSSCFPLSQLQSLELIEVNDLESLPEEWLGNLTSLQRLVKLEVVPS
uniref:Uncharacterized protein n=1 Tax=Fagus sylvatica TaxID=28930 RepID=A0A2N9H901_FAGSY